MGKLRSERIQKNDAGLRVIITGSTGMIGQAVLLECLDDPAIGSVIVINRRAGGIHHSKLTEYVLADIADVATLRDQLAGIDVCFFCLGTSAAGKTEAEYTRVTFDLTLRVATTLVSLNPRLSFCYVSGAGTDSTERGRMMWARVKGRLENTLMAMPFRSAYMFRPAMIIPKRGIRSRTPMYNIFYLILRPFFPLFASSTRYVTDTTTLARAMIRTVLSGYPKQILESEDINAIGRQSG